MRYSAETRHEVWNDDNGERYEVGRDRDGLSMIELRYYTDDGKRGSDFAFPMEAAEHIAAAILKLAAEIEAKDAI